MGFNLYLAGCECLTKDSDERLSHDKKLYTFASGAKKLETILDKLKDKPQNIFIDSGAFSLARSGKQIDVDQYIDFIDNHPYPKVYASLDIIPFPDINQKTVKESSDKSWVNYEYILKKVKDDNKDKILPTFHFGEPYEALERILNTEIEGRLTSYMGLGGLVGLSAIAIDRITERVFTLISKSRNPNIKVHAFGMTNFNLIKKYPFYSADSTSWIKTGAYGGIMTHWGVINVTERSKHTPNHLLNQSPIIQQAAREELDKKGFSLEKLKEDNMERIIWNGLFMSEWAKNFTYEPKKLFKKKKLF